MLFSDLPIDHRILKSLTVQGFEQATEIQQKAIPAAIQGKDILATSKTGSGKTLAYLIPALNRLLKQKALSKQDPRCLIVTPTRELAMQVYAETKKLLPGNMGKPTLLIGGDNFNDQVKSLKQRPVVLIGTPGRVADHLAGRSLYLEGLELLVLDEADRIMDLGFSQQLKAINSAANHRKRQTMLFSATFDNNDLALVSDKILSAPHKIVVDDFRVQHSDIEQRFIFADSLQHKQALLGKLLERIGGSGQAIVFVATRVDTQVLQDCLAENGTTALALHGELLQSQRNQIMQQFRQGQSKVLVTTDVASRGLDIPQVRLVINFDMPVKATEYVHRIGRTGRAGSSGTAYSLVGKKDWRNFIPVKQLLNSTPVFEELDGLVAKFKGLHDKPQLQSNQAKQPKPQNNKKKDPWAKQKKKFDATKGTDVGHLPLKRK